MSVRAILLITLMSAQTLEASAATSVYSTATATDAAVLSTSTLGHALPYLFSENVVKKRCPPCDPSEVNAFDRPVIGNFNKTAETISDISLAASIVTPFAVSAIDSGFNSTYGEDALIYAEVFMITGTLTNLSKFAVQRPRPRVYAGVDPEMAQRPDGYLSFFSGHSSISFAMLTATSVTYTLRHGGTPWPWLATAGLGTSIAVERVLAGKHFYSDVTVGAIVGTTVGVLVPLLHKRDQPIANSSATTTQTNSPGQLLFAWGWRF